MSRPPSGQTLPAPATTGSEGSVTFANLAPGICSYMVFASGYEDKLITVSVAVGQTQSSETNLTQVQKVPSRPSMDYTLYAGLGLGALIVISGVFLLLRRVLAARRKPV